MLSITKCYLDKVHYENEPRRNVTDPVTEMHTSILIEITIINNQFLDRKCFLSRALLIKAFKRALCTDTSLYIISLSRYNWNPETGCYR